MSSPFALHSLHRLASLFAPAALGGSGGATAPPAAAPAFAHVDPLVVGALLVTVGIIYAIIILAAVCIICWPRRLKWPESIQPDAHESPVVRPSESHRPLAAHRAPGTHAPSGSGASGPVVNPPWVYQRTAARRAHKHESVAGSASHDDAAWPVVEREVEGVGTVQWDGKTVRAFAGQPDVLQRLAFQRWRYREGRCSEFAVRGNPPRKLGAEQRSPTSGRQTAQRNDQGQTASATRRPGPRPAKPSTGRPTRVAQPTGGGAGPV